MSGPPKISPTDVARYFALVQPPLIANRLFEDTSFRTEFGLDSREAISFDGGPAILKATFYDGVRKMFAEQRPQFLAALTGDAITVTVIGDDIALSFQAEGGFYHHRTLTQPYVLVAVRRCAASRTSAYD